ncbi:RsmE family RNA methyltransferase [Rubinisphaera sp. JC750]|uniref:RsmE family RNA methyltransferase n=1 Tax=Rubinisphaera sp. JC750 TaxID=2898658 RepID=UPI001F35377D|nr:RsmE family RNA methyltransferase [Rubinisphaera sp. JC750]
MSQRYYCPQERFDEPFWLTDTEAHHLLNVMRAKPGAEVEVFNGDGLVATVIVAEASKRKALLQPVAGSQRQDPNGLSIPLTLATAVPKSDRFRWLVEKGTELGVTRLIPLKTSRSVVSPRESKLEKQQQYVVEACKQSGRNTLMEIGSLVDLADYLGQLPPEALLLTGAPAVADSKSLRNELAENRPAEVVLFVGPEGGFTPEEEDLLAEHGAKAISVGPYVLRTETAGLTLAAVAVAAIEACASENA